MTQDSRDASGDTVFVALRGLRVDGHRFVGSVAEGVVVVDRAVAVAEGVACVQVADTHLAFAQLAAALHGQPSRSLDVIGVTGTNGKTTCCAMLESIFKAAGRHVGVIGTTGHRIDGVEVDAGFTTPMPPQWQGLLRRMKDAGCEVVAAEVSSIGLAAKRVDATRFPVAVWTNLSQDHLDVHGDMQAYAAAKARLFTELLSPDGVAILNGEDPAVVGITGIPESATVWRFGISGGELCAEDLDERITGSDFTLRTPRGAAPVQLRLAGRFNVRNALAAAGAALALGLSVEEVAAGLSALTRVAGRLEPVERGQPFGVLVDYAHSDDALHEVLATLRPLTEGRLIVVFGCGGDRDRAKRPLMAAAVVEGADLVVATSDNPRSEDPLAILAEMRLPAEALVEPDRAAAIRLALSRAQPGDVVLIAGKGHETTQEIGGVMHPFDDRLVAAAALEARP